MSDAYSVSYSPEAMDDLREIYSYIAFTLLVPETAEKQVNRIRKEARSLNFMPSRYSLVDWEPPKGKKKGDKTPCDSSSMASKLLPLLERWYLKPDNPFSLIFQIYRQQFLDRSIQKGLIDPDHLALAGNVISSVTTSHVCGFPFLQ